MGEHRLVQPMELKRTSYMCVPVSFINFVPCNAKFGNYVFRVGDPIEVSCENCEGMSGRGGCTGNFKARVLTLHANIVLK